MLGSSGYPVEQLHRFEEKKIGSRHNHAFGAGPHARIFSPSLIMTVFMDLSKVCDSLHTSGQSVFLIYKQWFIIFPHNTLRVALTSWK